MRLKKFLVAINDSLLPTRYSSRGPEKLLEQDVSDYMILSWVYCAKVTDVLSGWMPILYS